MEPVMAAVGTALIGAADAVLAAWVQARARRRPRPGALPAGPRGPRKAGPGQRPGGALPR